MKTAIIGSGISGLGAAYLLNPHRDIVVYEKHHLPGGHCRSVDIEVEGLTFPVDTGFIVFNHRNYPLLSALFSRLAVPLVESDMSFGASIGNGWLEYGSKSLFAQKRNLLRPRFWFMLREILRFNREAQRYLAEPERGLSLRQCLDELRMGSWFRRYYLQPMGAAIWSCPTDTILDFPARTFIQFFANHGLLTIDQHPQWFSVQGGSREYVQRLCASFSSSIRLACGVEKVEHINGKQVIHDSLGRSEAYDEVIFACHADQTLAMLADPSDQERATLGAFRYQQNRVFLHGDTDFMPRRRDSWASWVYLSAKQKHGAPELALSYWMNNLQELPTSKPVIVTLNPTRRPKAALVYDEHVFRHPVFDIEAVDAQQKIDSLQGQNGRWYCGAWQRYGFHEDGLLSAVKIARRMDIPIPWI